jgi:hypothetical protein
MLPLPKNPQGFINFKACLYYMEGLCIFLEMTFIGKIDIVHKPIRRQY